MAVDCLLVLAWASSRAWTVAGWTMLHFLWVGAALGLVAAAIRVALRRAGPQPRYVAALVLFAVLALAPVGIWLSVSHSPGESSRPGGSRAGKPTRGIAATSTRRPEFHSVGQPIGRSGTPSYGSEFAAARGDGRPVEPLTASHDPPGWPSLIVTRALRILPFLWIAGSSVLLLLTFAGLSGAERLRRHSTPLADGPIAGPCAALARALGISRRVAVAVCDRLAGPVLVGVVRPCILLPSAALTGWTPPQLEMVLLHELAHIRRWDNLVNLLQRLVESALFFQPAVWWVSGWIRLEREQCCDELVVSRTGRPREYAHLLLALSEIVVYGGPLAADAHGRPAASLSMAGNHLVPRIRHILNKGVDPMPSSRAAFVLLLVSFAAALLLPVGLDQVATQAEDRQKPADRPASGDAPINAEPATSDGARRDAPGAGRRRSRVMNTGPVRVLVSLREGVLEAVTVRRGDAVEEGQVLARLAQGPLRLVEIDIRAAEKSLEAARLKFDEAERANDVTPNAVPKTTVAQFRVAMERAEIEVERVKAEYDSLKAALVISSPIDGVVVGVEHARGEWVKTGEPIVIVAVPEEASTTQTSDAKRTRSQGSATSAEAAPQQPDAVAKVEWPIVIEHAELAPGQSLTLASRRDGVLESVSVREGDGVEKGQVLASLPADALRIAEIDLQLAAKALEHAELEYARTRDSREKFGGSVTEKELARDKMEVERILLQLERAKLELDSLKNAVAIRSPIDGAVTALHHHAGESVKAGEPLAQVVNTEQLLVEVWLAYHHMWLVKPGARVEVRIRDIPDVDLEGKTFSGRVTYVDNAIDPVTGGVRVRARVENTDGLLKSGLRVEVKIHKPAGDIPQDENR